MRDNVVSLADYRGRTLVRPIISDGPYARWSASTDNSNVTFHEGWEDMYGADGVGLARRNWIRILHPDDRLQAAITMFKGRLSRQSYVSHYRAFIRGVYRPVTTLVFPVWDADGKLRWEGYNQMVQDDRAVSF